MELKISFKDGSRRVIKPSIEFFVTCPAINAKTGKLEPMTAAAKARSLAFSLGKPHTILLTQGSHVIINDVIHENEPERDIIAYLPKNEQLVNATA